MKEKLHLMIQRKISSTDSTEAERLQQNIKNILKADLKLFMVQNTRENIWN